MEKVFPDTLSRLWAHSRVGIWVYSLVIVDGWNRVVAQRSSAD